MSNDATPDRLRAFRAEYHRERLSAAPWWAYALLAAVLGGFGVLYWLPPQALRADPANAGLSPSDLRRYAAFLHEKNLPEAAITAYDDYLAVAHLAPEERARVCLTVAELHIGLSQYKDALARLYEAELYEPDRATGEQIGKKVTLCLERLGWTDALRRELRQRNARIQGESAAAPQSVVLAQWADSVITLDDLEQEIAQLPPAAQAPFESPERREGLLRNMVAERLLIEKARRLELDDSPEIQAALAAHLDALLVRKLLEDEVEKKVTVSEAEAERYYQTHADRFPGGVRREVRMGWGASADEAKAALESGGTAVVLRNGQASGPVLLEGGREAPADVLRWAATAPVDRALEPRAAGGVWYALRIAGEAREPLPFKDVKDEVMRQVHRQSVMEHMEALIDKTLEAESVVLFPEHLKAGKDGA